MTVSPKKKKKKSNFLSTNGIFMTLSESLYLLDASKGKTHNSIKQCVLFEGGGVEFSNQLNSENNSSCK